MEEPKALTKILTNLTKEVTEKFVGINIENYLNAFSIEDIQRVNKDGLRKVICFDDIERKALSIDMVDLLGLIERTTENFDVIVIANTNELTEEDSSILHRYSEKVINYHFNLNEIGNSLLKEILKTTLRNSDEIIKVYLEKFDTHNSTSDTYAARSLMNLRIFKKYVDLVNRSAKLIHDKNINSEWLRMCKLVVYDYHFPSTEKKSFNFDNLNLYTNLKKLFLFEELPANAFEIYQNKVAPIREDIKKLYSLYSLNELEFNQLIKHIDSNIEKNDQKYFINQENVISLASALEEINLLDEHRYKTLLKHAVAMFKLEDDLNYSKFQHSKWNSVDEWGNEIECSRQIQSFIKSLNERCLAKRNDYRQGLINNYKLHNDYENLLNLYEQDEINNLTDFEEIFNHYFSQLEVQYTKEVSDQINDLIFKTKSELISNFFTERIKTESFITNKKKYEQFDYMVVEKLKYEDQLELYLEQEQLERAVDDDY